MINKDNTFTDNAGEEVMSFLSASPKPLTVLEETETGLKFKGVALIDEAVSANDRYYSARFNDRCMEATNAFMAGGGTVTIYSRHGRAMAAVGQLETALPIGKVFAPFWREGREVFYKGFIVPTTEGKDTKALILAAVLMGTSIRAYNCQSRLQRMNGRTVEVMEEAVIAGIDLTDEPGIHGAGIRQILEEAPKLEEIEQEEDMDLKELTIEALQTGRPDLVKEIQATTVDANAAVAEDLKAKLAKAEADAKILVEERQKLAEGVAELKQANDALGLEAKIAVASLIGNLPKAVYEELKAKVKKPEDIVEAVKAAKEKALVEYALGAVSGDVIGPGKGTSKSEAITEGKVTEGEAEEEKLDPQFAKILGFCK
jgi:hypothetical protein